MKQLLRLLLLSIVFVRGVQAIIYEGGEEVFIPELVVIDDYGYETTVTDPGTYVECGMVLVDGRGSLLQIKNGGAVRCQMAKFYGDATEGIQYPQLYNHVYVNGEGSLLHISGNLNIFSPYATGQPGDIFDIPRPLPVSLLIDSGGKVVVEGSVSVENSNFYLGGGGRLETSNMIGDLRVGGTFAPGINQVDSLMDGVFTMISTGSLEIELGGYVPGVEHDRLTVTETANLGGTLDIALLNNFSVAYGDTFDLFNWEGGVSGEFATISPVALTGDLEWDTSELYTTGTLSVIPEPSVMAMVGVFSIGLWAFRRIFPDL